MKVFGTEGRRTRPPVTSDGAVWTVQLEYQSKPGCLLFPGPLIVLPVSGVATWNAVRNLMLGGPDLSELGGSIAFGPGLLILYLALLWAALKDPLALLLTRRYLETRPYAPALATRINWNDIRRLTVSRFEKAGGRGGVATVNYTLQCYTANGLHLLTTADDPEVIRWLAVVMGRLAQSAQSSEDGLADLSLVPPDEESDDIVQDD